MVTKKPVKKVKAEPKKVTKKEEQRYMEVDAKSEAIDDWLKLIGWLTIKWLKDHEVINTFVLIMENFLDRLEWDRKRNNIAMLIAKLTETLVK